MQKISANSSEKSEYHQPAPTCGFCHIISKVARAVSNFFRAIGRGFVEAGSWLKDRTIDLFPEQTAMRWDPRRIFVRTILDVAAEQRSAVLLYALPRIAPQMDGNVKEQLMKLVNNANPSSPLSRTMLRFVTPDMHSNNSIATTQAIAAIPPQQRNDDFFVYADQLTNEAMRKLSERAPVIEAVTAILPQYRQTIIPYAYPLITEEMNGQSRKAIIEAITAIPPEKREIVISYASQLIDKWEIGGHFRSEIIEAITAIPTDEQIKTVVDRAHQLLTDATNDRSRLIIIKTIIVHADRLITPGMSVADMETIYESMADIPVPERKEVVKNALLLITPEMDCGSRIRMIRAVVDITPANEREEIVSNAVLLITPKMDWYARIEMIKAVTAIPTKERGEIVSNAVLLITPKIDWYDIIGMIEAVTAMQTKEREEIVSNAVRLITPEMHYYEVIDIIKAVAAIPAKEREEIVSNAVLLITPEISHFGRTWTIKNVSYIPMNERGAVTALALLVIAPDMDASLRGDILRTVTEIPTINRKDVVHKAVLQITPEMDVYKRREMIKTIARNYRTKI